MKASLFILFSIGSLMNLSSASGADRYKNFEELSNAQKIGIDYDVIARDLHSQFCVIAIHGGGIEPGSDALAKSIASDDLSYYLFIAKKPSHNRELHITSTHFDDPEALSIVKKASTCFSIHGFKEEAKDIACIGGANTTLRDHIAAQLKSGEPSIEIDSPCEQFGGSSFKNITNLSKNRGVQIELSAHLRKALLRDQARLQHLARSIRSAVQQ